MLYLLVLINVVLLVFGQVLWKMELGRLQGSLTLEAIPRLLTSPFIWGGLFIYVLATVLWFYILSRGKLSVVYPLQSLAYVLGVLAALLIFREAVPLTRWLGVGLIVLGAFFVAWK